LGQIAHGLVMPFISGTLRSTPLPWLPVLSNIDPPALRRKAVTDKLVEKIVKTKLELVKGQAWMTGDSPLHAHTHGSIPSAVN